MIISWISPETLSQQFALCGVTEASSVVVLTDNLVTDLVQANNHDGLQKLGCRVDFFNIQWNQKETTSIKLKVKAFVVLTQADLVIDSPIASQRSTREFSSKSETDPLHSHFRV